MKGVGVFKGGDDSGQRPFVVLAAANLDRDAALDCWTIASISRFGLNGDPIPGGMPYHEQSDLTAEQQAAMVANAALEVAAQRKVERLKAAAQLGIVDAKEVEVFGTFRT